MVKIRGGGREDTHETVSILLSIKQSTATKVLTFIKVFMHGKDSKLLKR